MKKFLPLIFLLIAASTASAQTQLPDPPTLPSETTTFMSNPLMAGHRIWTSHVNAWDHLDNLGTTRGGVTGAEYKIGLRIAISYSLDIDGFIDDAQPIIWAPTHWHFAYLPDGVTKKYYFTQAGASDVVALRDLALVNDIFQATPGIDKRVAFNGNLDTEFPFYVYSYVVHRKKELVFKYLSVVDSDWWWQNYSEEGTHPQMLFVNKGIRPDEEGDGWWGGN